MKYDLIHICAFVLIKFFVMLCEYLIKNWMSSWFAVSLFVHTLYRSIRATRIRTVDNGPVQEVTQHYYNDWGITAISFCSSLHKLSWLSFLDGRAAQLAFYPYGL